MPGSDRPDSLTRAFLYLVVRLCEARASTLAGLIERALALIKAGFSFDESVIDEALPEIEDRAPKRVPHELVASLATALQCTLEERFVLMVAVFPTYIFGQHVSELRKRKDWSRGDLIRELLKLVPRGMIDREKISEGWLQQIEEGRKAKILRVAVVLLAEVLGCDYLDKFKLLLEAGYGSRTGSEEEISEEVDPLEFTAFLIREHRRGGELLKKTFADDPETFFKIGLGHMTGDTFGRNSSPPIVLVRTRMDLST